MTERASRLTRKSDPGANAPTPGVTEEVEVRGHIVDSLLLPKILDRILLMGGSFEIRECKIGVHRADPSYARIAIQAEKSGDARRDPGRSRRAWRLADSSRGRRTGRRRHRRCISRGVLQHDQSADPDPRAGALGRRARPGDGLRDRRRAGQGQSRAAFPMNRVDVGMPIVVGHAGVRVLPVERPRERELVRLHELHGLEREAQVDQREDHRRRDSGDACRREESLAGRRPGDRAHRLGAAGRPADQGGLGPGALRGQCAGHARHRAGALRHQPGRFAGPRRADRARSRAPSAGDQYHPTAGGNRPGGRERSGHVGDHVRMRQGRGGRRSRRLDSRRRPACPR